MLVLQKQLLIVLDDLEVSQLIRERLEKLTIKVDCATSVSKTLEYMMKKDYCLLIVDLQTPGIDSAETVRIFRVAKHI